MRGSLLQSMKQQNTIVVTKDEYLSYVRSQQNQFSLSSIQIRVIADMMYNEQSPTEMWVIGSILNDRVTMTV